MKQKQRQLDEKVFQNEIDFENFRLLLDSLNHVKPVYISREKYQNLNEDILKVTGEDKMGEFYDLFLPQDLNITELFSLTVFLMQKFKLKEFAHLENLISKVKLLVELITRELPSQKKEDFINEMLQKGNVDENLYYRVLSQKMLFGPTREVLKSFEGEKLSKEDLIAELQDILEKEFHLTFFRKGVNMLRLGMMTMTAGEIPAIKKKDGDIEIRIPQKQLDQIERLLRDKIKIDILKKELKAARILGNQKVIESIEKKAVNNIMYVFFEYPYQDTNENLGFKPSKILEQKELYCTGFSILGHAFLKELGIEHYGLTLDQHTALEVHIGGNRYFFDAAVEEKILKMKSGKKTGLLENVSVKGLDQEEFYILRGNPEEVLLSHIFSNLGTHASLLGENYSAIKFFQKSILLNPLNASGYRYLANEYHLLNNNKKACEIIQRAIELNPTEFYNFENYGVYLAQLKKYSQAIVQYKKALELTKNDPGLYLNMSTSYFHLEDYDACEYTAKQAGRIGGMKPEVYNALGLAYIKQGKIHEAISSFTHSIHEVPSDSYYYYNMGLALSESGNIKGAKYFYFAANVIDNVSKKKKLTQDEIIITQLIVKKDFSNLSKYMLNLIKNSN